MNDLGKKKRTRGYTNMLDVWDLLDGEFILIKVDHWGNSMGWEGKTLQNAIGSLVRRHQCAPWWKLACGASMEAGSLSFNEVL